MTWNYAHYIEGVAEAGKKEYPLPMYVNAWEAQLTYPRPGTYPTGGPNYRMLDVWRAAGRSIMRSRCRGLAERLCRSS